MSDKLILITRHKALVTYILKHLSKVGEIECVEHVTDPEQIRGRRVIGSLPLSMASLAKSITVISPVGLPHHLRGKDLTLPQLKKYMDKPRTYEIKEVNNPW